VIGTASAGSGIVAGAVSSPAVNAGAMGSSAVGAKITQTCSAGVIGSPAANAAAMGRSAVGAKITQTVFGRRYRQPDDECRRNGHLCSRLRLAGAIGSPV